MSESTKPTVVTEEQEKRKYLPAEDFVRIWQGARNMAEVCSKTGLVEGGAYGRAHRYRSKGIPLKRFDRNRPKMLDVASLTKIAQESLVEHLAE